MPNILVVTGSARPNSVNHKVVPVVVEEIEKQGAAAVVADVAKLDLPFFDAPHSPTSPDFEPTHDSVKAWTKMVADADAVVLVTPEYNHTLTPIQLNAIDWIGKEWAEKYIGLVGYGWGTGGGQAHDAAREAFEKVLNAHVVPTQANLFFMKHIQPDGSFVDEDASRQLISDTVSALVAAL